MVDRREAAHDDTLEASLAHYNASYRHRYRLPPMTLAVLSEAPGLDEAFDNLAVVRASGITDPGCAVIAQTVVPVVPRYAIGRYDEDGQVRVLAPTLSDVTAYQGRHVLLVNPLGGRDNWRSASRWLKEIAGDSARRSELAGLASEKRPDHEANEGLLFSAIDRGEHGIVLPPDEMFSVQRAAEVSFIYGIGAEIETLRSWKKRYRAELASKQRGAPRRKR